MPSFSSLLNFFKRTERASMCSCCCLRPSDESSRESNGGGKDMLLGLITAFLIALVLFMLCVPRPQPQPRRGAFVPYPSDY
ncbi:hypothetical protein FCM35_KLT10815 [Carex littledalei]|uniref:Uncharacterized protein n=1 Tax=Carex littledalei TaxID=544730 RepID=A0A833VIX9_9POAL|nr:hypothetical protein FCM35_KLT10815 [Carex littledalei]